MGDQRDLPAIASSAEGESNQSELPVLCFSGSQAPDFSLLLSFVLARKTRKLVLERKDELLAWFCLSLLPMPRCRSCLQPLVIAWVVMSLYGFWLKGVRDQGSHFFLLKLCLIGTLVPNIKIPRVPWSFAF